jgi:hypothetical protein
MRADVMLTVGFFLAIILGVGLYRGDMFSLAFVVATGKFLAWIAVMAGIAFLMEGAFNRRRAQWRERKSDRRPTDAATAQAFPPRSLFSVESVAADIFHNKLLKDTFARVQALPQTPMQRMLTWLCPHTMSLMRESIRYACADGWRLLHEGDTEENRKASEALSQHRARHMAKTYRQGITLGLKRGMLILFSACALFALIIHWMEPRPVPLSEQTHSCVETLRDTPVKTGRKLGW